MRNKSIILIIVLATVLRLIGINQSMWLDEAISANVVINYDLIDIVKSFSPSDFHPPFFYLTLKIWTNIFGHSVIAMRLMSVLFGVITTYFVYKIGNQIKDKKIGLMAMIFTAVNPFLIYYSQEIKMYSMVTCLLTMAFYFYLKDKKIINMVIFNILCAFSFLTFYGSIFYIATLSVITLFKKNWSKLFIQNIGIIIAIILVWPLLSRQLLLSKDLLVEVKNWSSVLGKIETKNILMIPIKFSSGRISFYPKIIYYLVSGIWAIIVFFGIFKGIFKEKLLGIVAFLPLVFGLIFSAFSPMMQYFRFQYLIPIMMILLAISIKNKNINKLYLLCFLSFSFVYLLNKNMWREDWLTLSQNIDNKIIMIESFSDPIKYYKNTAQVIDIRKYDFNDKEITVVPYGEAIHGIDHNKILEEKNYTLKSQNNFREVLFETWTKQ